MVVPRLWKLDETHFSLVWVSHRMYFEGLRESWSISIFSFLSETSSFLKIIFSFFSPAYQADVMNGQVIELVVFFYGIGNVSVQNTRLKVLIFPFPLQFFITQFSILINLFQHFRLWQPRRRSLSMKWWSVGRNKYTGCKCRNPRINRWNNFKICK